MSHFYNSNYNNIHPTKITRAIKKYGFDSIEWSILFESEDENLINQKEKEFIFLYDSVKQGYNISKGGDGGDTISNNERKLDIIKSQLKSKGMDPEKYVVIDEELEAKILADYQNVNGIRTLSKKYNISRQRLRRFLLSKGIKIDTEMGTKMNTFQPSMELINRVCDSFKSGKTINQISENENLTILIVSRILHDSDIRKSKRFINGKRYDGKQPKKRQLDN